MAIEDYGCRFRDPIAAMDEMWTLELFIQSIEYRSGY